MFRTCPPLVPFVVALLLPGLSPAQTVVEPPPALRAAPPAQLSFPATFGVPSAVAPRAGTAFVGASFAHPRAGMKGLGSDGDLVLGYNTGDPIDGVSLTFGLALTGLEPFGDAGAFSVSASRLLRAGGASATFAGVSLSNLAPWGEAADRPEMSSVYVSHLVGLPAAGAELPLQISLGYGTDTTRAADGSGRLDDGAFLGLGLGLTPFVSGSVSATETQVNLGATVSIPRTGASLSLGVLDAADATDHRQVSLSIALGF
ncbi:hypothetical protein [Histidinibacterium lentulum]|uniref:Transporter n=1 Tax=Histidinibacterium lentulum TaxID=2480588 RepID=A0A3N2R953_9RHOB|nr:hypothetical protein [Histidinibacterium lentulum]ROU03947.1 hypothetical protein EAT49_00660 [Histidinibacterium lentulum]